MYTAARMLLETAAAALKGDTSESAIGNKISQRRGGAFTIFLQSHESGKRSHWPPARRNNDARAAEAAGLIAINIEIERQRFIRRVGNRSHTIKRYAQFVRYVQDACGFHFDGIAAFAQRPLFFHGACDPVFRYHGRLCVPDVNFRRAHGFAVHVIPDNNVARPKLGIERAAESGADESLHVLQSFRRFARHLRRELRAWAMRGKYGSAAVQDALPREPQRPIQCFDARSVPQDAAKFGGFGGYKYQRHT